MNRAIRATAGLFLTSAVFFNAAFVEAFTPSQEQIQQFKNLSPAEQKRLAQQAGIDIGSFQPSSGSSDQPQLSEESPPKSPTLPDNPTTVTAKKNQNTSTRDTTQPLPLFGSDIFTNTESMRPAVTVPVPANYILGPGDNIIIQLYGKENATHSLVVDREGRVLFPQIGPVNLAGLSFQSAQNTIADIVAEQKIGVKASVTMGTLRTIRIFVLGDVQRPGSFTIGALSTLTNALFESGGITEVGTFRNIQLKRNGELAATFDLYDLLLKGDTSKDVRLLPGDVIFVPPIGATVSIDGEVNRPARYELKNTETAKGLIELAGGLRNTAFKQQVQLIRLDHQGEKNILNLNLLERPQQNFKLQNGDYLSIASTLDFVNNKITVSGHVKRPGVRSWTPQLRFTDVITAPTELLPNPDIDVALVKRYDPKTLEVSALIFSPKRAWANPEGEHNLTLQKRDELQLFDYESNRNETIEPLVNQLTVQADFTETLQVVSVNGSVRFEGTYPITPQMTTAELIMLAGGLTESAMGTQGEITRYSVNDARMREVLHIPVNFMQPPVALAAGDILQVKQIPLWKTKEQVTLQGEVMFPGTYTILPGETLTSVLTRAGGLTPQAYPQGAIFSRKELRELEAKRLEEFKGKLENDIAAQSVAADDNERTVDLGEAQALLKNLGQLKPLGRMVIDLPQITDTPEDADFELEDGDTLTIPRYKPSVTVVGEVQYPTSHFFEEPYDATDYIERSGGFKKHADQARVYIVKANGLVVQPPKSRWFRAKTSAILPGDTIVVPLETDKLDKLSIWAKVTQIMYQAALGAAAVNGL